MFARKATVLALENALRTLQTELADLKVRVWESSAAALKGRVDELEHSLDTLRQQNRREFGRLWHAQRQDMQPNVSSSGDPEFDAYIELQKNGANGGGTGT